MLYDTRWDRTETKPDVFSLESLIAWLQKQPWNGKYEYSNCRECLLTQYFLAMGYQNVEIDDLSLRHDGGKIALPSLFNAIALDKSEIFHRPGDYRWTFGAALDRARKALA